MRQNAPGPTGSQKREDRINQLPRIGPAVSAARFSRLDHRLDQAPLTVAHIGGVGTPLKRLFRGIGCD